jgi:hypothetical protein
MFVLIDAVVSQVVSSLALQSVTLNGITNNTTGQDQLGRKKRLMLMKSVWTEFLCGHLDKVSLWTLFQGMLMAAEL